MAKFCSNCGMQFDDSANVCSNCGSPLKQVSSPAAPQPQPQKSNKKIIIAVIAIIAVLAVIGGVVAAILLKDKDDSEDSSSKTKKKAETEEVSKDGKEEKENEKEEEKNYNDSGKTNDVNKISTDLNVKFTETVRIYMPYENVTVDVELPMSINHFNKEIVKYTKATVVNEDDHYDGGYCIELSDDGWGCVENYEEATDAEWTIDFGTYDDILVGFECDIDEAVSKFQVLPWEINGIRLGMRSSEVQSLSISKNFESDFEYDNGLEYYYIVLSNDALKDLGYGYLVDNAIKESCNANKRVIKGNMETYAMVGNDGDAVEFAEGDTVLSDTLPERFTSLFDGGVLPTCPKDGSKYYVCVHKEGDSISYIVKCADEEHNN